MTAATIARLRASIAAVEVRLTGSPADRVDAAHTLRLLYDDLEAAEAAMRRQNANVVSPAQEDTQQKA